ncbi:MAG: UPF0280 family protein [Candidatus Bathyarchaeia archaeon]
MIYEYGFLMKYSKIHIKSDRKEAIFKSAEEIKRHIKELLRYVGENPYFKYSLEPLDVGSEVPVIVQRMVEASNIAGVGPMASVAGVIADLGLEALLKAGASVALVENGGEFSAYTAGEDIVASISTGEPLLSGKIGFLITKSDSRLGVGTSSGKVGRTVSFGEADSVTVVADNAAIADAAATSICNAVTGSDVRGSIAKGLEKAKNIRGVRGVIIVREDCVGLMGKLPKIIRIR